MTKEIVSCRYTFKFLIFLGMQLCLSCAGKMSVEDVARSGNGIQGIELPAGFAMEQATLPGLVKYPMFASLDNNGRLFVMESSGKTTSTEDVLKNPTFQILLLEDSDQDGVYDKRYVYADSIPYPMGGTFYQGSFYATAPPDLIRLNDTDDDGVADEREVILTGWTLNHNAATLSGPFFGPDGWLYMCDARRGFDIQTKEGTRLQGKGARIWRCRPDGTGLESISGGGFDNSIELIFMPSGETIGTMTYFTDPQDGFRDALMHWVEGGVYPKPYQVIEEDALIRTGDLMPVMTKMPRVSPSGLMRYRGETFGADFDGNLFSAQFNTGRVVRHIIKSDGATFSTEEVPFLQWDKLEMHPTDVLEDADGSLLVVNTGGWFIAGCPLSVVAKEDFAGSIVRVRKINATHPDDSWGRQIDFEKLPAQKLTELLSDHRPMVRDKAVETLIKNGEVSIETLSELLEKSPIEKERLTAVFALYRIQTPAAMKAALAGLRDKSALVRTAAARVAGLSRSRDAVTQLTALLSDNSLPVRRQSATALGQIGDEAAAAALVKAAANPGDRFVEHAITYALITLGNTDPLVNALHDPSQNVRRMALIALDQVSGSRLTRSDVSPFLRGDDVNSRRAAVWVASRHPDWGDMVVSVIKPYFSADQLSETDRELVKDLLLAFKENSVVQKFISAQLSTHSGSTQTSALLLDVIGSSAGDIPNAWLQSLAAILRKGDEQVQLSVLRLLESRKTCGMEKSLEIIVDDNAASPSVRMNALRALLTCRPQISDSHFNTVMSYIGQSNEPFVRQAATSSLAGAKLTNEHLLTLAEGPLREAETYLLPGMVSVFAGYNDEKVGEAFVRSLSQRSDGVENLDPEDLEKMLSTFPESVKQKVKPLVEKIKESRASRLGRMEELQHSLKAGDVGRGRDLFFGKALCSTCHAVSGAGGDFGPDLTNIGEIRAQHDILEAILYPAASLAREYETSKVVTSTTSYTGIVKEQVGDVLVLQTGADTEVKIPRNDITGIEPLDVSLMPPGLERQLTHEELSDLMAYLSTLPDGLGHLKHNP